MSPDVPRGQRLSIFIKELGIVCAWIMIFWPRKGDEIPTLSCYWVVPLRSIYAGVQYMQTRFTQNDVNQPRDESYSKCNTTYPAALFNSKVNELKRYVLKMQTANQFFLNFSTNVLLLVY